jgi:hypothetical protein
VTSPEANGEAEYCSSAAAWSTRSRVAADTFGMSRSARETVATETPARAATSTMLALGACVAFLVSATVVLPA